MSSLMYQVDSIHVCILENGRQLAVRKRRVLREVRIVVVKVRGHGILERHLYEAWHIVQ